MLLVWNDLCILRQRALLKVGDKSSCTILNSLEIAIFLPPHRDVNHAPTERVLTKKFANYTQRGSDRTTNGQDARRAHHHARSNASSSRSSKSPGVADASFDEPQVDGPMRHTAVDRRDEAGSTDAMEEISSIPSHLEYRTAVSAACHIQLSWREYGSDVERSDPQHTRQLH